jgi:DNA-binding beta-propeller fold protein YncE
VLRRRLAMLNTGRGWAGAPIVPVVRRLAAAAILGGVLACSMGPLPPPSWNHPEVSLVWPRDSESERARIEYLGVLSTPADLGRKVGLFERLNHLLFGEERVALLRPISVAKNRAGMLVVADPGVPAVYLFDLVGREFRRLDGEAASLLRSPIGVAIDDAGRVYVADSVRGRVFVFHESSKLVEELGEDVLIRPTGLALDPAQEHLYVVDTLACAVFVFDRAGRKIGGFGRRGVAPGEFNSPTFVTVAPDGTVSVSDSLNFRVQSFRPDGTPIAAFGLPGDGAGHFARPKGIAADTEGRLYVVDAAFENVQIFDPDGTLLLPFGSPGNGPGEFSLPGGLFIDSTDTIWVTDSFNRRIQVFRLLAGGP